MTSCCQIQLHPHPVAVPADDPASKRRLLIVAYCDNVGRLGVEADVMRSGTVRDPALDYEVAPHLVGVVVQVVALFGHVLMLPPARAGPHRVLFGLGEVTADAGELGRGGLGENDGPVRVIPGGREGETVPKQVGAGCFEEPTAIDQ